MRQICAWESLTADTAELKKSLSLPKEWCFSVIWEDGKLWVDQHVPGTWERSLELSSYRQPMHFFNLVVSQEFQF